MFLRYEEFLSDFDEVLRILFKNHAKYIKCKKGCSKCCEKGNYPCSQTEFAYLTKGFINLSGDTKKIVREKIQNLLKEKTKTSGEFSHECPFLINKECCIYEYRPIVCRTFGLCYYDDNNGYVRLPDCVYDGLNYSGYFDKDENILKINDVPKVNLRIDRVFNSKLSEKYNLNCTQIRPMLEWLEKK